MSFKKQFQPIYVLIGGKTPILNLNKMQDDPQRRKPDITRARTILGWEPKVKMICLGFSFTAPDHLSINWIF